MAVTAIPVGALAIAAAAAAAVLWARRRLVLITVDGISMTPTYQPGDRLMVSRRLRGLPAVGQVVVVERPVPGSGWRGLKPLDRSLDNRRWLVKRVAAVPGDPIPELVRQRLGLPDGARVGGGEIVLLGEHADSEDSKLWGGFPVDRVLGVVLRRL
ncbi:MAG: hypothetical protein HOV87_17390 [Catenulispora sp.]|nr:hypothetical protein [Catenulispora sp.]